MSAANDAGMLWNAMNSMNSVNAVVTTPMYTSGAQGTSPVVAGIFKLGEIVFEAANGGPDLMTVIANVPASTPTTVSCMATKGSSWSSNFGATFPLTCMW